MLARIHDMHPLLQIIELLHLIFGHLDKEDQAVCAQVCKNWSEIALDILWHTVDNLPAFANLLAPVKRDVDENNEKAPVSYSFEPPGPTAKSWARFEAKYCSRVRVLGLDVDAEQKDNKDEEDEVHEDVSPLLQTIQRFRFASPLLPKLHTFGWNSQISKFVESIMFMHEGVKVCCIEHENDDLDLRDIEHLFEVIYTRMPALTSIKIGLFPSQSIVVPLLSLLEHLTHLTDITMPAFTDVSKLLSLLGNSKRLRRLKLCYYFSKDDLAVTLTGNPYEGRSFAALESLWMYCIRYQSLLPFGRCRSLANLHSLSLFSINLEKPEGVRDLFHTIPTFAPNLVDLKVMYSCRSDIEDDLEDDPLLDDIVSFTDFRAVLACRKITRFVLNHPYPVNVTDSDLEEIASAWSHLRFIEISVDPAVPSLTSRTRKPTIRGVYMLARCCPNLQVARLLLDTTTTVLTAEPDSKLATLCCATYLRNLHVGNSLMQREQVYPFAMALAQVCSPWFELLDWVGDNPRTYAKEREMKARILALERENEVLKANRESS
ncbi:hypothetical protein D9758_012978 [Tetrapyrgos nigripes]|uniref:F-box domain-containing protein n=1 Tax=Tetrapyrgos nigripes TaxID=182062 RepID=A0A8H5FNQ9_9AGAR|nr:hypothetical protein D9758_012978 [Tetrapyrgos nigripes]